MFTPQAMPEPLAQVLTQVREWSGDDARSALVSEGAEARAAWLAGLQHLADAVDGGRVDSCRGVRCPRRRRSTARCGNTSAWLRGALRLTGPEASERVRVARAYPYGAG